MVGARLAPAALLRGFRTAHPDLPLDVVTLFDVDPALTALRTRLAGARPPRGAARTWTPGRAENVRGVFRP
ncbi:hypothetical protein [Streptomyces sp. NPDC086519]|uniref:hypothetical protein n=1 Tax=Streptomyces sp. NPDC086519 TaxID=3154863 RepID=UPI0034257C37